MKRLALLVPLLACSWAHADYVLKNAGTAIGPATSLNCSADAGIFCSRASGAVGTLRCAEATAVEPGCITPNTQSLAGNKTLAGAFVATSVDAGWVQGGSIHAEGSTLTCSSTTLPFVLESYTPDGITSSTVPAMKFKLRASISGGDLGWLWEDSAGTKRMGLDGRGQLEVGQIITDDAAATVSADFLGCYPGAGGAASGATPAGTGGMFQVIAGQGGASSASTTGGQGGDVSLSAGAGGTTATTQSGGAGGNMTLFGGSGIYGGAAGTVTIRAGQGGYQLSGGPSAAAGGVTSVSGGQGGAATVGTAGAGGALTLAGGIGGAGISGTAGAGGPLILKSGAGGTVGAAGGASGDVTLDTGVATGAASNGVINIGTTSATGITIGRADIPTAVVLPGTLTSGGQPTQIAQVLLTGDVGTPFSKHSNLSAQSIDFPNILAQTCNDQTQSLANAVADDTVFCSFPAALATGLSPSCFISAPGTVTFRLCNVTVGAINPAAGNFGARRFAN